MSELKVDVLKSIVDKVPGDFLVEFEYSQGKVCSLSDDIRVKVSEKKLVLSLY